MERKLTCWWKKNKNKKKTKATRGVLCRKNFKRMKTHALASLVIQRNVREWLNKQPSGRSPAENQEEGLLLEAREEKENPSDERLPVFSELVFESETTAAAAAGAVVVVVVPTNSISTSNSLSMG
jgi:hypothetical protein